MRRGLDVPLIPSAIPPQSSPRPPTTPTTPSANPANPATAATATAPDAWEPDAWETATEPVEAVDWVQCGRCAATIYRKALVRALGVCPECEWHSRLTAHQRLRQLLDSGSIRPITSSGTQVDPIEFSDVVPYRDRLADARAATGLDEAAVGATGTIRGRRLAVAVMDFQFLGGSLGAGVGELIVRVAEESLRHLIPLLLVSASGGARMQEGVVALMQMAKTSEALGRLDESGVLTISLVTDPTYGGVAASFVTLADVIIAEPGARLGFAGPRVIEQTIGRRLPEGFQGAEALVGRGQVDRVVPRAELRSTLAQVLAAQPPLGRRTAAPKPRRRYAGPPFVREPERLAQRDAWEVVQLARHVGRPTTLDHVSRAFDGFLELRGDRISADCPAIVGGLAVVDGFSVMLIGHQKGHTTRELAARNFGMSGPDGYRKAARLMRLAAKLGLAVVTLVDTPGAHPGQAAEEGGQASAIAENLRLMASLPVPVVAVITGEGGSGGALALGVADRVFAFSNAVYSVISPEGCAAILWKSAAAAPTAAVRLGMDARSLLGLGVVDGVIEEPAGGAHLDPVATSERLRQAVSYALAELIDQDPDLRRRERRRRLRNYGLVAGLPGSAQLPGSGGSDD